MVPLLSEVTLLPTVSLLFSFIVSLGSDSFIGSLGSDSFIGSFDSDSFIRSFDSKEYIYRTIYCQMVPMVLMVLMVLMVPMVQLFNKVFFKTFFKSLEKCINGFDIWPLYYPWSLINTNSYLFGLLPPAPSKFCLVL